MGFSHIQIATNGIRMADLDFARQAAAAGLHVLYLQFDGVGEEPYRSTRNYPGIWAKKVAAIENCRKTGMKVCLVPTILKSVNDDQVADIFRFAVKNIDVVSAISYQPVSFTGRMEAQDLERYRYTLGDLAHGIAAASDTVPLRDMFPLSVVVPLAQILEALTGNAKIRPSCHTDCAFGKLSYKTLLCAGMHFQDRYNYDVERAKRCVILYSTPGGVFPFCTYNCGPEYRKLVEKAYAKQGRLEIQPTHVKSPND